MQIHDARPDDGKSLTPLIGAVINDFQKRHDLTEVVALHARLADVCGDDTVLNIICDHTGCHLHVTTFGRRREPI